MTGRGIFSGVLILAGLQAAVSSQQSAGRVGGIFEGIGSLVVHALSPFEPAIPDLRNSTATPPPPPPPPPGRGRRGGRSDRPVVPGNNSGVLV